VIVQGCQMGSSVAWISIPKHWGIMDYIPLTWWSFGGVWFRWKYKLLFPNQPLLKGYRLLQAANYLRKTSSSSFNGMSVLSRVVAYDIAAVVIESCSYENSCFLVI
jgi:hypothetical protein